MLRVIKGFAVVAASFVLLGLATIPAQAATVPTSLASPTSEPTPIVSPSDLRNPALPEYIEPIGSMTRRQLQDAVFTDSITIDDQQRKIESLSGRLSLIMVLFIGLIIFVIVRFLTRKFGSRHEQTSNTEPPLKQ